MAWLAPGLAAGGGAVGRDPGSVIIGDIGGTAAVARGGGGGGGRGLGVLIVASDFIATDPEAEAVGPLQFASWASAFSTESNLATLQISQ